MSKTVWWFSIDLLCGGPPEHRLRDVYSVLTGDPAFFDARRYDDAGWPLDMADPAGYLASKHVRLYHRAKQPRVELHGPGPMRLGKFYVNVEFALADNGFGRVTGVTSVADPHIVVDRVVRLAALLDAPLAIIEPDANGWHRARSNAHLEAARTALGRKAFPFNSRWGLCGLAYRTVIGAPFIDLIGPDALAALPMDRAWPTQGLWVLSGTFEGDDDRRAQVWGAHERASIEALGRHFFFDPETGTLPTALPIWSQHPRFPCYLRDPNSGELVSIPAGALPPPPPPDPLQNRRSRVMDDEWTDPNPEMDPLDFIIMATTANAQIGRLHPEFWSDQPIYWVEEFLRGRADDGDFDRHAGNFGAWLGEFMRAYLDCEWVVVDGSSAGWAMRAQDGQLYDPFGLVRQIRTARNDPILLPVLKGLKPHFNFTEPDAA